MRAQKAELRALVLTGDGINCERETAFAFQRAGFVPVVRHLNDLIAEKVDGDRLAREWAVLAIPGGFSFGDDLASGKVLALKILHGLRWDLTKYADRGGLVIGICNGFQSLIRMGVFGREISITHNRGAGFIDTWVRARVWGERCVWLRDMDEFDVPIRHGEGRLLIDPAHRVEVHHRWDEGGEGCLRYLSDPNGSDSKVAGLCDRSGRILGLMPHPEAHIRATAHPEWTLHPELAHRDGAGLKLFVNAYQEAMNARS